MNIELEKLRSLTILQSLPDEPLEWLSKHAVKLELSTGDRLFTRGDVANCMFIIVSGAIQRFEEIAGQWLHVSTTDQGQVTGTLPFSRMTHYPGHGVASAPSEVLCVEKADFNELLMVSHELGQRLVGEMSNRVRGIVRLEQQREKMISLGRLSAGLAHELNNPAAAIRSTSDKLAICQNQFSELNSKLAQSNLNEPMIKAMSQFRELALDRRVRDDQTLLMRSNRDEELSNWLISNNISRYWEIVAAFTDSEITIKDLDNFAATFPSELLEDALAWVARSIEIDRMISEIKVAAERISSLVNSVKAYSNMDRSSEHKQIDVREGLDNTIIMLEHRLKDMSIRLTRDYDENTPKIDGNIGELNQVWTNLIENALDAMNENGELIIKTENNKWGVIVRIIDDGCGIPEELLDHVFDPFVTTKGVGEGTGLGLNISRSILSTHGGQIEIIRQTRGTEVCVRLPFKSYLEEES